MEIGVDFCSCHRHGFDNTGISKKNSSGIPVFFWSEIVLLLKYF